MNKIKNALYGVTASVIALAPAVASAQWKVDNGVGNTNLKGGTIGTTIELIVNYLLAIVGILGILGFVVSGILYLTAAGDEDQVGKAKNAMMYSIIGVIVALLGFVVISAISQVFVGRSAAF